MEEKYFEEARNDNDTGEASDHAVSGAGRHEKPARKNRLVSPLLAGAALAAVIGVVTFSVGRHTAAAVPTKPAAPAPVRAAEIRTGAVAPQVLAAGREEARSDDAESPREEAERTFKDGDYSGKTDAEGKDSDGMTLPKPGSGESLYIGYGELPHVGMTKMAFILSEDGASIHDVAVFLKGFDKQVGGGAMAGISSIQSSNTRSFSFPVKDQPLGDSTLQEIAPDGEWIHVRMDYSCRYYAVFGQDSQLIHLGETEFWMKKAG